MSYYPKALIRIGKYKFEYCHSLEVRSSWKDLGDSCTIKLPNLKGLLEDNIKTGDRVEVYAAYEKSGLAGDNTTPNGDLPLLFKGYVSELVPKIPFELKCEDEVWQLKRHKLTDKAWKVTTLKEIISYVLPAGMSANTKTLPDIKFNQFRVSKVTSAEVLQKLKEAYNLAIYFRCPTQYSPTPNPSPVERGSELYIGMPYLESLEGNEFGFAGFNFQKNIVETTLTYKKAEDVKIKAKITAIHKDNTRTTFEDGDTDGETRSIFLSTETKNISELKKIAQRELEKYKYEGYRGSFTAFGTPKIIHSGTVDIEDTDYPQRKGSYIVESVTTKLGVAMMRQVIELGKKV